VIEDGDPPTRKALLQFLVDAIRVVSRAEIFPVLIHRRTRGVAVKAV